MATARLEGENKEFSNQAKEYFEKKALLIGWDLEGRNVMHPEVGQTLFLKHLHKRQMVFMTEERNVVILASFDTLEISNFNRHFKRLMRLQNKLPITVTYINSSEGEGIEFYNRFLPLNALNKNMRFKVVKLSNFRYPIYRDELRHSEHFHGETI